MKRHYKLESIDVLYHGTNSLIRTVDPSKGRNFKDFGRGFYTTTNRNQAIEWALGRADEYDGNDAYVYSYVVDRSSIKDRRIREFLEYDEEWLEYVVKCRKENYSSDYEIVYDRMADGAVRKVIDEYYSKEIRNKDALKKLSAWKNKNMDQYCFRSKEACDMLKLREVTNYKKDIDGKWEERVNTYGSEPEQDR